MRSSAVRRSARTAALGLIAAGLAASLAAVAVVPARADEAPRGTATAAASGRGRAAPPDGGKILYDRYCASCHGPDGRGDGPAAASLKQPPTDLTTLAQRSGGKIDEAALMAVIDGRRAIAAHGSREMPVWGAVFDAELAGARHARRTGLMRSRVLADYVVSLQKR